jgi:small GTP-binding protein
MNTVKMIVCGDGAVGKTTLLKRLSGTLKPDENVTMTPGVAVHVLKFEVENIVKCACFDLGGQERFRFLQGSLIKGASIAMFVYSVEWFRSLSDIDDWLKLVAEHALPKRLFLIANKIDSPRRVLVESDGQEYASQHGMTFHEVSAITGQGVDALESSLHEAISSISRNEVEPANSLPSSGGLLGE